MLYKLQNIPSYVSSFLPGKLHNSLSQLRQKKHPTQGLDWDTKAFCVPDFSILLLHTLLGGNRDSVYCDSTYVRSLGRGIWYLPIGDGDFTIGHRYILSPECPGQSKLPRQQRMSAWAPPSAVCRCSSLCSWPHVFLALRFGFHVWTRVPWLWPFVLSEKTHFSSC